MISYIWLEARAGGSDWRHWPEALPGPSGWKLSLETMSWDGASEPVMPRCLRGTKLWSSQELCKTVRTPFS